VTFLGGIRRRLAMMVGGFDGGLSARRLRGFHASRAHVNALIQAAGADLTARARYLVRNNGYAANAVESWAGNVVGTGIKPSARASDPGVKDRLQRLWLAWTDEADADGLTDFYGLQRRAARELFIAGEIFARSRHPRSQLILRIERIDHRDAGRREVRDVTRHDSKPVLERRGRDREVHALVADLVGQPPPSTGDVQTDRQYSTFVQPESDVEPVRQSLGEPRIDTSLTLDAAFDLADRHHADEEPVRSRGPNPGD
jgi:capsid protein